MSRRPYDTSAIRILMDAKKWDDALDHINHLLKIHPSDDYLTVLKANCVRLIGSSRELLKAVDAKMGDEFIAALADAFSVRDGFKQIQKSKIVDALASMIIEITSERFKDLEARIAKLEFGESHDQT